MAVADACKLFRKPKPVTPQTVTEQIRNGGLIAYRTGGGQYMLPVWQFRPEGGVIKGLPAVLKAIREQIPGYACPFCIFSDPGSDYRRSLADRSIESG